MIKALITPQEAETRFLSRPWSLINDITMNYLAKRIYAESDLPAKHIASLQPVYLERKKDWPYEGFSEKFHRNPSDFFVKLAESSNTAYHYFGDFHSRLHNTCVSETPAERKIKHAKRMMTKHRHSTKPATVVQYLKASGRKDEGK